MDTYNLVEAVEAGDAPGVGAALAAGADPNARLRGGATHLMRAAARGDLAVVRTLLEGGADAGAQRGTGRRP